MVRLMLALGLAVFLPGLASTEVRCVTTLSTFASLVQEIGGDLVNVSSVAPAQFNPHFIEPRPSDVLRTKRADLFFHAGLDLEPWRYALLDAAANPNIRPGADGDVDMSRGVMLLEVPSGIVSRSEGDIHMFGNPHYWLSPENVVVMSREVEAALVKRDPLNAQAYRHRSAEFRAKLQAAMNDWTKDSAAVSGQELVGYHNEWVYLTNFMGLRMDKFLEPKPGIPPSPRHIEELEHYMKEHGVRVIVQATFYPDKAAASLAERVSGKALKICQNVYELPECGDYVSMLNFNIRSILAALR